MKEELLRLTATQCAYVLATPLDERPMEACWIAFQARAGSSSDFALFARRNKRLVERSRNYADTMFLYRLTEEGAALRASVKEQNNGK